jgi:hypothetical protein
MSGDPCIGEYVSFGFSECAGAPGLRYLQNSMDYPAGFESCPDMDYNFDGTPESEEEHCGGLVWGGAPGTSLKRSVADRGPVTQTHATPPPPVLESHFFIDQVATFRARPPPPSALADELLHGGAHEVTTARFSSTVESTAAPYLHRLRLRPRAHPPLFAA